MDGAVLFSIRDVMVSDHLLPLREQIPITYLEDLATFPGQVSQRSRFY